MRGRRISQNNAKKRNKFSIPWRKILILFSLTVFLTYFGYFLFVFFSIKTENLILTGSVENYLLSKNTDDLEKTLIVLEEGVDEQRRISHVYLVLSNREKDLSMVIYIPGDIYFEALKEDFGSSIPVSSLRFAGDFLQEGRGVEYAVWQLTQMLGVKVNDYIWFSSEALDTFEKIFGDLSHVKQSLKEYYKVEDGTQVGDNFLKLHTVSFSQSYLKMFLKAQLLEGLDNKIYSNLSSADVFWKIGTFDRNVKGMETYAIDVSHYKYLEESMSEQGGQITSLNTTSFDSAFRKFYSKVVDRSLEEERVRVEVYNGSGIAGSAFQLGRKIENSGCDVVRYGNSPKNIEKTLVYVPKKESFQESYTVIEEILSGMFEFVEGRPEFMTTGDIVIILGEDIKLMYRF